MTTFTLTGTFTHQNGITPISKSPIHVQADPFPLGSSVQTDRVEKVTDANGTVTFTLTTGVTGLYYVVRSTAKRPLFKPIRFLAPAAGTVLNINSLIFYNPGDPPLEQDLIAIRDATTQAQSAAVAAVASVKIGTWQANTPYVSGQTAQAPDGSLIKSASSRTSRASFDATEQTSWTPVSTTTGTLERVGLDVAYGTHDVDVERVRLVADTDAQALQRAVNIAKATGKRRILIPKGYTASSTVDLAGLNGVTIEGAGPDVSIITGTTALTSAWNASADVSDLMFKGVGFKGTNVDDVTGPRRSRTNTGPCFSTAVLLQGDLASLSKLAADASSGATTLSIATNVGAGTFKLGSETITITSVTGASTPFTATLAAPLTSAHAAATNRVTPVAVIRNVRFEDFSCIGIPTGLPIFMQGIRGIVELDGYRAENCFDTGFTYCENVDVHRFTSRKSCDNGISISRGVGRATISGFDIEGAAFSGIWVAGYVDTANGIGDTGPTGFTVGQGVIRNVGISGIQAYNAPKGGAISGVTIDTVLRGPSDQPNDQAGVGIKIGGYPYDDPSHTTDFAENVTVSGSTLLNCQRGGVHLRAAKVTKISDLTIVNPGTQFLADGVTAILASNMDQNFGVAVDSSFGSTVSDVSVRDVLTVDNRGTAFANSGVYLTGAVRPDFSGNLARGMRTPQVYDSAVTVPAPTGIVGRLRYLRDGVRRWDVSLNASDDLEIDAADTAGSFLRSAVTIGRTSGQWVFSASERLYIPRIFGGGSATTLTVQSGAGAGATSTGSAGKDLAGAVVITTAGAPFAGAIVTVNYTSTQASAPFPIIAATSSAADAAGLYVSGSSTTAFTVSSRNAASAGQTLSFNYQVIG